MAFLQYKNSKYIPIEEIILRTYKNERSNRKIDLQQLEKAPSERRARFFAVKVPFLRPNLQ